MHCFVVFFLIFPLISTQRIPQNPCPNLFSYSRDLNGIYFGEIQIPNDGSSVFTLSVNVSLIGYYNNLKLSLSMLTPTESVLTSRFLNYRVDFPLQNVLPKLTQIVFNGNIHCYGPPETLGPQGVTDLWSKLVFTIRTNPVSQQIFPSQPIEIFVVTSIRPPANQIQAQNPWTNQIQSQPSTTNQNRPPRPASNQELPTRPPTNQEFPTRLPANPAPQPRPPANQERPPLDLSPDPSTFQRPQPSQNNQCGLSTDSPSHHEFPWLVATFHRQGVSYIFRCTANLLTNRHVLTAGHCVQYYKAPLVPTSDILLVLGQSDLSNWAVSGANNLRSVANVRVHPQYTQDSGHCDIAVLTMSQPVDLSANISPICIGNIALREDGIVTGWGRDESGHETVPKPTKTTMPMVSQEECLKSHLGFQNLTSDKTFCAGNRDGSGVCTGDSGAGFVVKVGKRWYLRGIVSTAIKINDVACNLNEYVVFADVSKLYEWIQSAVR